MPPSCLFEKETLLKLIFEKLGTIPLDFKDNFTRANPAMHQTAGVLLLLEYQEKPGSSEPYRGEFYFHLIKRSAFVAQPGDLSCPGGMLSPFLDQMTRPLVAGGILPTMQGKARAFALSRDAVTFRLITLFLANALRESWEEIGLSPFNVSFLGPLPTYTLMMFRRTIFPLVGLIKHPWQIRPSEEVEKTVRIPLRNFYNEACFGRYVIDSTAAKPGENNLPWEFPCLIYTDENGNEDVLWGATFQIIVIFLKAVLDYELPAWQLQKTILRTLPDNYATGQKS